ncbi:NAD(P)H-dependent flavin oxidoreductase [Arthrobacter sp. C152]
MGATLRTPVCDLLGIEHPIVQAGMGLFGSGPALAAAVSTAGALGSLGGALRTSEELRAGIRHIRELTDGPFAVNFTQPWLQGHPESLDIALDLGAPVVSLALGDPGDLPAKAHAAGALFIQQVHTVQQARLAVDRGADVIIAQGAEAGGFGGTVSSFVLLPQVVDTVAPVPVLAAGGIADGRGVAAAMALGAQGVNVGTRFLASVEASISEDWKRALVAAEAPDAVKVEVWDDIFPKPANGAFDVVPRALRTPFISKWQTDRTGAARQAAGLQEDLAAGMREGRMEEYVPFTGQSAGLISSILPAAVIVEQLVAEAVGALTRIRDLGG